MEAGGACDGRGRGKGRVGERIERSSEGQGRGGQESRKKKGQGVEREGGRNGCTYTYGWMDGWMD
eukprot:1605966-Rhodomonas_salina.2